MLAEALVYDLPHAAYATKPPEARGVPRDEVRLLVQARRGGRPPAHTTFRHLAEHLRPGDLLVANDSATLPAALPAWGPNSLLLHLGNRLADASWLVEPRTAMGGPLEAGPQADDTLIVGPDPDTVLLRVKLLERYRTFARLWRAEVEGDLPRALNSVGRPIAYPYLEGRWPLDAYQSVFARVAGSAEMPSAGRPFSRRVLASLSAHGVRLATITLHTGLASHEVETVRVEDAPMYPEWFKVSRDAAEAVERARSQGNRVIAVGTTVVRALESALDDTGNVEATEGYTEVFITPERGVRVVDGLITGLHAPRSSHLALLGAFIHPAALYSAYREAIRLGYLWHEFGDSHLILP